MGTTWRCLECGALYEQHFAMCVSCFRTGGIIPVPRRLHAAVDFQPGSSNARRLARMAWRTVEHEGAYSELSLGAGALVEASGGPGQGKSTVACRLLDAVAGPVLYVAAEEGLSPTLSARLLRCNIRREDFFVLTRATVDAVVTFASEHKVAAVCIDSVDACAWTANELRHVLEVVPTLDLLIAVMQVTKNGLPAGAMALQHEADVHLSVENMTWKLIKSRYQALTNVCGDVLPQRREEAPDDAA